MPAADDVHAVSGATNRVVPSGNVADATSSDTEPGYCTRLVAPVQVAGATCSPVRMAEAFPVRRESLGWWLHAAMINTRDGAAVKVEDRRSIARSRCGGASHQLP